jgi:hypothetical protein
MLLVASPSGLPRIELDRSTDRTMINNVEETPEQVLARLERYYQTLQRGDVVRVRTVSGSAFARMQSPRARHVGARRPPYMPPAIANGRFDELPLTSGSSSRLLVVRRSAPTKNILWTELLRVGVAAFGCFLAVVAFVAFDRKTAIIADVALMTPGVVVIVRRISVGAWWTVGVVAGLALGRLS